MREMKDSGIEWISEIPSNWSVHRLKYIVKSLSKGNGITKEDILDNGDTPCIRYGEIYSKYGYSFIECISRTNIDRVTSPQYFSYGDILFAGTGELIEEIGTNIVYLGNEVCLAGGDIIIAKHIQNPTFLNYALNSHYIQSQKGFGKAKLKVVHISAFDLGNILVALPPINEQKQIADYLDIKCRDFDAIIDDIQAQIDTLELYKRSIITEAVTKGLDPDVEMKDSGVQWLGDIPKHWSLYRIASLYAERNENGNDELPLLSVSIHTGVSDAELSDEESSRVFIRSEDKTKYKRVYPQDLTYNMMRAWQGAFGAVRVNGMVSPAYVVAKPLREIDTRYIEALLRTPSAIQEMHRHSYGVADFRLRLYWDKFRTIKICFPPLDEQRRIADYIDEKSNEIDSIISEKKQQIETIEEYKKSLIFEYVTGKKEVTTNV